MSIRQNRIRQTGPNSSSLVVPPPIASAVDLEFVLELCRPLELPVENRRDCFMIVRLLEYSPSLACALPP